MPDRRWIMLAAVFVTRTGMAYQFQSIGSVGPMLVTSLMIDFAALGTLIGLYKLPGVLMAYPSGLLGRRHGDRTMVIFGAVLMTLGGLLTLFVDSHGLILLGRIISGVGAVIFNVLSAKLVLDWFAARGATLAMSVHISSWPLGLALGLTTQAGLAQAFSLTGMMAITTAICALGLGLMLGLTRDPQGGATAAATGRQWSLSAVTFRQLTLAAMVWCLLNVAFILVIGFGPAYLADRGYSVTEAGRLSSLLTWASILSVPVGGWVVQRYGHADLLIGLSFLGGILSIFAIDQVSNPAIPILLVGLIGVMNAGAVIALPAEVLKPEERSVGMGLFFSYYYLGMGVFPPVAGWLRDLTGAASAPLWFAGFVMLAAWGFMVLFRLDQRRIR